MTRDLVLAPADNIRLVELCGPLDQHLHQIESRLGVEVKRRGNRFQIIGMPLAIKYAETVLQDLYTRAQREPVDSERVHIALQELGMAGGSGEERANAGSDGAAGGESGSTAGDRSAADPREAGDELKVRTSRGAVRARGTHQTEYLNNVRTHDLTFGIGPAGTGKTYLAVACAVEALQSGESAQNHSGAAGGRGRRAPGFLAR